MTELKSNLRYVRLPSLKLYGSEIALQYPLITYRKSGKRILIVSDSLSVEEADEGKLFCGDVGTVIAGAFETAIQHEGQSPRQVLSVTTRRVKRPSQLSDAQSGHNDRQIIRQLRRVINKWQPDVVVFLGFQSFLRLWRPHVRTTERSYTNDQLILLRGRLIPARIGRHACQIILSFSTRSVASQEYKNYKNKINLLGFTIRDFASAINGNNRYTVPEVDKSKNQIVRTIKQFDTFYRELLQCKTPSIDTESDNLNRVYGNQLLVILVSLDGEGAYEIPIHHPQTPFLPKEIDYIISKFRWYFEHGLSRFHIYQFAKFDLAMFFSQLKIRYYNHRVYDISVGEYFLDENRKFMRDEGIPGSYNLELLGAQYGALGYEDSPIQKSDRDRMRDFSLEETLAYGDKDVIYPWHICRFQMMEATRRGPDYSLFLQTVCELGSDTILDFVDMEQTGVKVDHQYLTSLMAPNSQLMIELGKLQAKIRENPHVRAVNRKLLRQQGMPDDDRVSIFNGNGKNGNGHDDLWVFDINKQQHQQMLFFQELGLEALEYRKDGGGKTNKVFLTEYKDTCSEVALLADWRMHEKLRNTYVVGLYKQLTKNQDNFTDRRLRPFFDFLMILTTRASANNPNLQNIPNHGPLAKIIKRLFIAELGYLFIKVDYSAHEVRGWANISRDHQIAASFAEGMKLRRQIRLTLARDPELDHELAAYVAEIGWFDKVKDDKGNKADKYSVDDKRKLVRRLDNSHPKLAKVLALMIDLQIRGDVHRMNYQFFFGKPAETVNGEERQSIKEVVFGVIYGKQAKALAESIYRKQIKPIRAKYMPLIRAAMRDGDNEKADRINKHMYRKLQPFYDKAQAIIDKLGDTFKRGWRWLGKTQERGRETLRVISPFGAVRHLWAYLHNDYAVQGMMDRRGPNSIIQGPSSNIIFTAARQMAELVWQLRQNKLRLGWRNNNSVHDSLLTENKIAMLPVALYYMEHSLTSRVHQKCREVYGFDMIIGLEIEFEVGGCEAYMEKWDFTEASLMQTVEAGIAWQEKELGYKLDKTNLLDRVRHNYRLVNKYRIKELQAQGDSYAPSEEMLMTPEIAAQQLWK
jgi:DNA polymerase I-like protein with 3'-5' exonuclease and polymerase domains